MKKIIDRIIEILITIIMGIMVVAVCWQVFTRYVLKNPSVYTEEALRYLLIWTTMVGAAYAYGKRKHLSINIIINKFSNHILIIDTMINIVIIIFCIVVLLFGGFNLLQTADGMVSAAMGIPMQYVYLSIIVCAILFIFYCIIFIKENIEKMIKDKNNN